MSLVKIDGLVNDLIRWPMIRMLDLAVHLNKQPGMPEKAIPQWAQTARHAIDALEAGAIDRLIDLPPGVSDCLTNAGTQSPAWHVVEHWNLGGFVAWPEEQA